MKSKAAVRRIVEELKVLYPNARCSLEYKKDYELLFAVRLSAQCTDARVNMVTPSLYQKFPTLEAFANATYEEVGDAIRSCGFYNTKSKDIVECAKILLEKYGGKVPGTMEELTALPGIGRKTANLILGDVYGQPAYVCDTHCIRITGRLGLTDGSKDPLSVEKQLRTIDEAETDGYFPAIAAALFRMVKAVSQNRSLLVEYGALMGSLATICEKGSEEDLSLLRIFASSRADSVRKRR